MNDQDKVLWMMLFSSILGFNNHPGAGTKEHRRLTTAECAREADLAFREFKQRDTGEFPWDI